MNSQLQFLFFFPSFVCLSIFIQIPFSLQNPFHFSRFHWSFWSIHAYNTDSFIALLGQFPCIDMDIFIHFPHALPYLLNHSLHTNKSSSYTLICSLSNLNLLTTIMFSCSIKGPLDSREFKAQQFLFSSYYHIMQHGKEESFRSLQLEVHGRLIT